MTVNWGEVVSLAIAALGTVTATVIGIAQLLNSRFNKLDSKIDSNHGMLDKKIDSHHVAAIKAREQLRAENLEQHSHVEGALHDLESKVNTWIVTHIEKFHSK